MQNWDRPEDNDVLASVASHHQHPPPSSLNSGLNPPLLSLRVALVEIVPAETVGEDMVARQRGQQGASAQEEGEHALADRDEALQKAPHHEHELRGNQPDTVVRCGRTLAIGTGAPEGWEEDPQRSALELAYREVHIWHRTPHSHWRCR